MSPLLLAEEIPLISSPHPKEVETLCPPCFAHFHGVPGPFFHLSSIPSGRLFSVISPDPDLLRLIFQTGPKTEHLLGRKLCGFGLRGFSHSWFLDSRF